ncbi:MAG: hypothetical protein MPW15_10655 [Candidatus Manganitrophus sp.]|nr:hypothetical protein [Candidatus Manganitrophus sp.]
MLSLLDVLADRLRKNTERTYSAPLATHAYAKETVEMPDGTQARLFPRLPYGGAHLADPEKEWSRDVTFTALQGGLLGLVAALVVNIHFLFLLSRRHGTEPGETAQAILQGKTDTAWRATLGTITFMLIVAGIAWSLSTRYHLFGTDKVGQDVLYLTLKSDPHRAGHRHGDDAGDAAFRRAARHRRRLLPRLGR